MRRADGRLPIRSHIISLDRSLQPGQLVGRHRKLSLTLGDLPVIGAEQLSKVGDLGVKHHPASVPQAGIGAGYHSVQIGGTTNRLYDLR